MRRTERGIAMFVGVLALTIAACGNKDEGDPPAVAAPAKPAPTSGESKSETPAAAAGVAESKPPSPRPVEAPKDDPPPKPATLKELRAVIDLRTFPVMEGAEATTQTPLGSHFRVPKADKATVVRVMEFYRAKLTEAGWKPSAEPGLSQLYDQGAQLHFEKAGYTLYAVMGLSRGFEENTKDLNAGLFYLGNLDARRLPRMPGGKVTSAQPARVVYETESKPEAIKKFIRDEVKKQGWVEFDPPDLVGVPRHLTRSELALHFLQGAAVIDVHLTAEKDATRVNGSVAMSEIQLPILPDAAGIEFDKSTPILLYKTAKEFEATIGFLRKELAAFGWKERDGAGKIDKGRAVLAFDMPDHKPLRLDVLQIPKGSFVQFKRWTGDDPAAEEK